MSLATLLQWLKILHFLRIFDSTGFLVRAIIEVVTRMRFFLFILIVIILAFADALKVMFLVENDSDGSEPRHSIGIYIFGGFLICLDKFDGVDPGTVAPLYVYTI